ncbi:DJ-1/PfpI family protein [Cohnella faecalis]|uniref:DJ-1/PfpI family protein n=1 Tax=Cohnella faecalis TaxID=2315694 RepID=A0A398CRQ5_9BACL|nr:DJ-1/PfpI family protein [Cohnella faecalis]RIE05242.1 DJ-1/PfpI family protein [Cohnella faecalis]
MLNVQIVLFDGFDLMDALAPYEVFCAAGIFAEGSIDVQLVTAEGPRSVPSGINGLIIEAGGSLNPERPGIILVPGASGEVHGDGPRSVPTILTRAMNTELTDMMKQALGHKDVTVATVCGGSLVLAMGGLLEGRPVVTNAMGMGLLCATGAIPVSARVVEDGNLVSGGGVTSGLDVALHLVERKLGPRIAHAIEGLFEYEKRGTVWRESGMAPSAPSAIDEAQDITSDARRRDVVSDFNGEWDTIIATPVGKLSVKLEIAARNGEMIEGMATQGGERSAFLNPKFEDHVLRWQQRITKPMRLNLTFEVSVSGDRMIGIAKAGILPSSKLTGTRVL